MLKTALKVRIVESISVPHEEKIQNVRTNPIAYSFKQSSDDLLAGFRTIPPEKLQLGKTDETPAVADPSMTILLKTICVA